MNLVSNEKNRSTKISITLDSYLKKEIDNISAELGKTRSGLISDAVEYYLDFLDMTIAKRRLNDTSDEVISAKEMENFVNGMDSKL
ncbi:ribbon-helix-helix domain-containing protein [Campylobacter sp. RM16192]|uniref:ribbon-helix-helix domain-containing protein n=1 Tax=Campylobacter sp. RM16192 TaxID=1660080 RepID=UPI001598B983|nr:ribbon-helix-helix domain-containing protein [Campylobacter sp. RM16192]QKU36229.1 hypothetical protein CDOMC_a016 [Campylobacter sp. RM16192]